MINLCTDYLMVNELMMVNDGELMISMVILMVNGRYWLAVASDDELYHH